MGVYGPHRAVAPVRTSQGARGNTSKGSEMNHIELASIGLSMAKAKTLGKRGFDWLYLDSTWPLSDHASKIAAKGIKTEYEAYRCVIETCIHQSAAQGWLEWKVKHG